MKTTEITIESEWKRRTDLIESSDFRKECAKYAKKMGITSQEWDLNKVEIMIIIANEICSHENKLNKK